MPIELSTANPKQVSFPLYITLAHLFHAPQGWHIKERVLNQYQLQYVVKGMVSYTIEDKEYITKRGDLLIHQPFERHAVNMIDGEPYLCISILFHFGTYPISMDWIHKGSHLKGTFVRDAIEQKLSQLIVLYPQPGEFKQVICQGLLLQVLGEIEEQQMLFVQSPIQHRNQSKMVLVRNYIQEHFHEKISLGDLEQISGFHRNSILREFKKSFGQSPIYYLNTLRIEKAKEMVLQTNYSVTEIAKQVGYDDIHAFCKLFKRKTGVSVGQYSAAVITT